MAVGSMYLGMKMSLFSAIMHSSHGFQHPNNSAMLHIPRSLHIADHFRSWIDSARSLPLPVQVAFTVATSLALILAFTRVYTTIRYRVALAKYLAVTDTSSKDTAPLLPPQIPYNIPFLGNARSFLAPKPGLFWQWLFSFHPPSAGCCTLQLGPRTAHILHNPASVQALFKTKDANRLEFNIQIARTSLKVPEEDVRKYHGTDKKDKRLHFEIQEEDPVHIAEKVNTDTLLKTDAVNELTAEFSRQFKGQLDCMDTAKDFGLVNWLQKHMFEASGRAFMGEKVFQYYPDFCEEFWEFERNMLSLFFGIPEFLLPGAVKARDQVIAGLVKWHDGLERDGLNKIVDSAGDVPWEPNYGSRANRARQEMYNKMNLTQKGKAGFDLGFTFALASNAIPATGWMLLHILDPRADKTLLPRVMAELESAQLPDESLNLPVLFALPLFQSILHEVLRLYTDVLVSRSLEKDHVLPLSGPGNRQVFLRKGTLAIAPSCLGQRDPTVWNEPPYDVFYPERFLTTNAETGKDVFSMTGTAGRYFPFGGGKSICPGRVFAKQEVLAATALVLLEFNFDVQGSVDPQGKGTDKFPGLRDGFGGGGVILQGGDIRVRAKRRKV